MQTEAQGKIAAIVDDDMKAVWKSAQAQKHFKMHDKDGSGKLEKGELIKLAEWVWHSFNPKQTITDEQRET